MFTHQKSDGTAPHAPHSCRCVGGSASADITPPVGIYSRMWGAALHDCATEIHRPLLAQALVVRADPTPGSDAKSTPLFSVILTLDCCIMQKKETCELTAHICAATGIAAAQLLLTMSHTHAAVGILSREPEFTSRSGGELIAPYFELVKQRSAKVVTRAMEGAVPAWLSFGAGHCPLAQHRDTWRDGATVGCDYVSCAVAVPGGETAAGPLISFGDGEAATGATAAAAAAVEEKQAAARAALLENAALAANDEQIAARGDAPIGVFAKPEEQVEGQWVCGFNSSAEGQADDTLVVGRLSTRAEDSTGDSAAADGATICCFFNYACHPTTLGPKSVVISPDFIGAAREELKQRYGGDAIFLQGASGELGPMVSYEGDPRWADINGEMLGLHAVAAVAGLTSHAGRQLVYDGTVVSGATLGTWRQEPLPADGGVSVVSSELLDVPLPLKQQRPLEELQVSFASLEADALALKESDTDGAESVAYRDARAMSERARRAIGRCKSTPDGDTYIAKVSVFRWGDAVVVGAPGELYSVFQTELRRRHPALTIVVVTLSNASAELAYILPCELCGSGVYQDDLMIARPGALERMIDAVSERLKAIV